MIRVYASSQFFEPRRFRATLCRTLRAAYPPPQAAKAAKKGGISLPALFPGATMDTNNQISDEREHPWQSLDAGSRYPITPGRGWIDESQHKNPPGDRNLVVRFSPDGQSLGALDLSLPAVPGRLPGNGYPCSRAKIGRCPPLTAYQSSRRRSKRSSPHHRYRPGRSR